MKKLMLLFAIFSILGLQVYAQNTVTGKVIDDSGEALPGVSVLVKGTTIGTMTLGDGTYSIQVPEGSNTLVFSYIGMETQEVAITGDVLDVTLQPSSEDIGEVIVSGVAGATRTENLTVSVSKVSEDQIKNVTASSAAGALQGKLAGVTIVSGDGTPGSAQAIRLRGATSIYGSQAPLIIVDGVQLQGTLADVNVDDIESFEVVKGASASALYGSRAGNGVIVVTTKRGKGLAKNTTSVIFRNEYGLSSLGHVMDVATHHQYELQDDFASETRYTKYAGVFTYGDSTYQTNPDSIGYVLDGALSVSPDGYMDNEYGVVHDHLREFYQGGNWYTNYLAVQSRSDKTNFMASFENHRKSGIVDLVDGFSRKSFRLNVDHNLSDKFKFSASNVYVKTSTDNSNFDFFSLMQLAPDMDLYAKNPDGTDYRLNVDHWGTTLNPIYQIANTSDYTTRDKILGAYNISYIPFEWLTFDAKYTFENSAENNNSYQPKYYLTPTTMTTGGWGGYLYARNAKLLSQTAQATANINKSFGDLITKVKLSALYENYEYNLFNTTGYGFIVSDIYTFDNVDADRVYNSSGYQAYKALNYFGIVDLNYQNKYLFSGLIRYDGASQFGENERWKPYFRLSGAYRISQAISIPGIQELKIRAAYGTAGNRPPWNAQYETWKISGGSVSKDQLGNKDLKPSKIVEMEAGLNVKFLNKFTFEFVYSNTDAKDQYYPVPLSSTKGGYVVQWQNMGTINSEVFEATLGADLVNKKDFSWTMNFNFDRIRNKVSQLNVSPFIYGARGNSGDPGAFRVEDGISFGAIYGVKFVETLDEMAAQLPDGMTIDDYTVNSDGYVIEKGTEGTLYESVFVLKDENGVDKKQVIGDSNPKFRLGVANTLSYKGFTFYALLDWKYGGDIYNLTNQWMYRDYRSADMDMFNVPDQQKKSVNYYQSLYNVASITQHFVEDGTYLKVRELSLSYLIPGSKLGNFIKGIKIGVIGRNVFTFTNYSGFDPEIGSTEGSGDATIQAWDEFSYPNFRTFSASIEFTF